MLIDVITIFPSMFDGVLSESMLKIAQEKGLLRVEIHNLRDFTTDKHRKVDGPPFGGGPGMVIMAEPVFRAVEWLRENGRQSSELIMLTPQGERYTQHIARELAKKSGLILLAGHYEGFDERIRLGLSPREISIGDYILTGGEIPAMVLIDSIARLIPGVLGDPASLEHESFGEEGLFDHPHYTRPRCFRGMKVPEVLLSGNHAAIEKWRREQRAMRTPK